MNSKLKLLLLHPNCSNRRRKTIIFITFIYSVFKKRESNPKYINMLNNINYVLYILLKQRQMQ